MKRTILVLTVCVFLSACGGGGDGGDGDPVLDDDGLPISDKLTSAKDYLAAGDIALARDAYTAVIGDATPAKVIDSGNAEARFGRAFCNLILLIEKDPSASMLAGFGQSPWTVSTIFGADGYFAKSVNNPKPDYSALPFRNMKECTDASASKGDWRNRCAISKVVPGYKPQQIASSLNDLTASVDEIIGDLLIAIVTPSANYTIPKGLYSGDVDISLHHADMVQILAAMYGFKTASDLANSWSFDIDLSQLVDAVGHGLMTREAAVELLNNDEQFSLRSDHRLSSARTNLQSWATYSKQSLNEVLAGAAGGVLNLSSGNTQIYTELLSMVTDLESSLAGNVAITDLQPEITANLDNFFNDPPNGAEIESVPFVLEGKKIRAVELFWQPMISKACNFQIGINGTKNVKVFSEDVRKIQRPYYEMFNTIMGHYFGKHRAGRGA